MPDFLLLPLFAALLLFDEAPPLDFLAAPDLAALLAELFELAAPLPPPIALLPAWTAPRTAPAAAPSRALVATSPAISTTFSAIFLMLPAADLLPEDFPPPDLLPVDLLPEDLPLDDLPPPEDLLPEDFALEDLLADDLLLEVLAFEVLALDFFAAPPVDFFAAVLLPPDLAAVGFFAADFAPVDLAVVDFPAAFPVAFPADLFADFAFPAAAVLPFEADLPAVEVFFAGAGFFAAVEAVAFWAGALFFAAPAVLDLLESFDFAVGIFFSFFCFGLSKARYNILLINSSNQSIYCGKHLIPCNKLRYKYYKRTFTLNNSRVSRIFFSFSHIFKGFYNFSFVLLFLK